MPPVPLLLFIGGVVLVLVAVAAVALGAMTRAHQAAVQCSTIASELSQSLARARKLEISVAELDDLCHRTNDSIKKLRSRAGMQELRARDEQNDGKNLTGSAWKDWFRRNNKPNVGVKGMNTGAGSLE
jgi:hypothetical protein